MFLVSFPVKGRSGEAERDLDQRVILNVRLPRHFGISVPRNDVFMQKGGKGKIRRALDCGIATLRSQ